MMDQNKENKINAFLIIFRTISLIIILICLYALYNWDIENDKNNEIITNIRSQIEFPESYENDPLHEEEFMDFSGLLETNPNTVAWIKVNNTDVDFPVVKGDDNNYYLKHNINNEYNSAGWIYADFRNKFDGTDKNIVIYGHNRRDGSMFSTLKNTIEKVWHTNEENWIIPLYTPTANKKYQIFSLYYILASTVSDPIVETEENFENYLNDIISKSVYDFNINVSKDDNILTLFTCGNNTKYRVLIHAKEIVD